MPSLLPFFWFDGRVAEAIDHYQAIFADLKVLHRQDMPDGSTQMATLELLDQKLILFNGGPTYKLNCAASLFISCETQEEIDHFYDRLSEGGEEMPCGWVTDKFGLSWQVVPALLPELIGAPDRKKADRALQAMFKMKKFNIGEMQRAFDGE